MPVVEHLPQHQAYEHSVGDDAHRPDSDFIHDVITDDRSSRGVARGLAEAMRVVEALEQAAYFQVAKVMEPFEFHDARCPTGPKREVGKRAE